MRHISWFDRGGVRLAGASWRDAMKVARGRGTPRTPGSGKDIENSHLGRGAGNRRAVRPNVGVAPMEWVWARRFPAPLPGRERLVFCLPGVARNTAHPWLPSPHPSGMTSSNCRRGPAFMFAAAGERVSRQDPETPSLGTTIFGSWRETNVDRQPRRWKPVIPNPAQRVRDLLA